jgi:hypothetical protein
MRSANILIAMSLTQVLLSVFFSTPTEAQPAAPAAAGPVNTHARPPVPFQFMSKAEIEKREARPGPVKSYVVTDHENYDVEYVTRELVTNRIECHMYFLDYVTVLDGEGTLSYGGTPVDPSYKNSSEPTGTAMTGATVISLHPGDYLVVPAGVWHAFSGTADKPLKYVIFKQRE